VQTSYPVRDQDVFIGRVWVYEDITRARELIYMAERDSLTGLYNRRRFNEELARMVANVNRHHTLGALLFFDLDGFKYVNDTFGHHAGDVVLIRIANEVGGLIRRNEIFTRLGGDEFAVIIPEGGEADASGLAERILPKISQITFEFEGKAARVTASIGIAVYPLHAANAEELIAHADAGMYESKKAGKNTWRLHRQDQDAPPKKVKKVNRLP
jgi:diguanylate cyclase (GGDEF)-like protein